MNVFSKVLQETGGGQESPLSEDFESCEEEMIDLQQVLKEGFCTPLSEEEDMRPSPSINTGRIGRSCIKF